MTEKAKITEQPTEQPPVVPNQPVTDANPPAAPEAAPVKAAKPAQTYKIEVICLDGQPQTFTTTNRKIARAAAMFSAATEGKVTINVTRIAEKTVKFRGV